MSDRRLLAAALLGVAACADAPAPQRADVPPPTGEVVSTAPVPARVDSAPALLPASDTALTAEVWRRGPREYSIRGATRAAALLEITVEDGHRVLYGPTTLPVEGGRFHLELATEPTQQRHTTLILTTPDGARQWFIPFPADSTRVRFGPS